LGQSTIDDNACPIEHLKGGKVQSVKGNVTPKIERNGSEHTAYKASVESIHDEAPHTLSCYRVSSEQKFIRPGYFPLSTWQYKALTDQMLSLLI